MAKPKKTKKPEAKPKSLIKLTDRSMPNSVTVDGATSWVRFSLGKNDLVAEIRDFSEDGIALRISTGSSIHQALSIVPEDRGSVYLFVRSEREESHGD